jgi:hydroxypyruvate reductase
VSLADVRQTTRLLLEGGVPIDGINTVRKHLSRISGGRLALAAAPARVLALVLSDVVGDDPAVIASGPTVPDPTTVPDALAVLHDAGLMDAVPPAVRRHLDAGAAGEIADTPGPEHPAFGAVTTRVIGTNGTALDAAAREAARLGYAVERVERAVEGEARDVGRRVAEAALALPTDRPTCRLWGGETTVTVTGDGRGGRNQEVALGAAIALDGAEADVVVLSGGTDGIDGPTDAAGGWASPRTADAVRQAGLDPAARLADNDAYAALDAAGALVRTGPTHTNVADVIVALRAPRGATS